MSDSISKNPGLSKVDRIALYKEERRKQLGTQIEARLAEERRVLRREPSTTSQQQNGSASSPRTTRASRLRAAQVALENGTGGRGQGSNSTEKTSNILPSSVKTSSAKISSDNYGSEKDKSSWRKSFLNRSLNSEEVNSKDCTFTGDDQFVTRRKRRVHPIVDTNLSETSLSHQSSTLNITASSNSDSVLTTTTAKYTKTTPKKSQLAIHMENARKGISSDNLPKKKTNNSRGSLSPIDKSLRSSNGSPQTSKLNKENIVKQPDKNEDEHKKNTNRLKNISALTKETLARVERLANKNRESPVKELQNNSVKSRNSPIKEAKITSNRCRSSLEKAGPSILKKKSIEEPIEFLQPFSPPPVSILKRKVSQDEKGESSTNVTTHTPPVTFSPSVKEPSSSSSSSRKQQGILKKRRSLDEALVLRRRSCSPEASSKGRDSRSILKNQKRRSSLEELTRIESPDNNNIQGILKRRSSKFNEDENTLDQSFSSPQGILKRKSGASSAGSNNNSSYTPHVSITTAVILAAASGAEMVLESENAVRPILKKKSMSDEQSSSFSDNSSNDVPTMRPILKKKTSVDVEDSEDKPKPILKSYWRCSLKKEITTSEAVEGNNIVRPILKSSREDFVDVEVEGGSGVSREVLRRHRQRRSHTVCGALMDELEVEEEEKKKRRSVSELVTSFEEATKVTGGTGAIPKARRGTVKRQGERYKTQPITSDEVEASLLYVAQPSCNPLSRQYSLTSPTTIREPRAEQNCVKVSSDSAFQSLLDGLEMEGEAEVKEISPKSLRPKSGGGLDQLMKAIADEAKSVRLNEGVGNVDVKKKSGLGAEKLKNVRRTTQPVTLNEVQEASKLQDDDSVTLKSPALLAMHDVTRDEGISSNDDESGESDDSRGKIVGRVGEKSTLRVDNDKPTTQLTRLSRSASARAPSTSSSSKWGYGRSGGDSSESESSGAREVRSILEGEKSTANVKKALEGLLSKNKSDANVCDVGRKVTVRRSQTVNYKKKGEMPQTIAELQATLQKKGESEWRKRFGQNNTVDDELKLLKEKNKYNVELSEKTTILASKKDELDAASKKWKSRVEKSDADKFSVSRRMEKSKESIPVNIPSIDDPKRTPQAKRFRGKEKDSSSTPTSPEKNGHLGLKRSQSNPDPTHQSSPFRNVTPSPKIVTKNVTVLKPDDFTFKNFYKNMEVTHSKVSREEELGTSSVAFALTDLDAISRDGTLLVQKKNVRVQKRRVATKNPIRALAERDDIKQEYTEVLTGVAERETKRLNIEKLAKSSSNFAIEALAGLASKEDFKSIPLKKNTGPSSALLPYKDVMLMQVKGRRHVQLRLVEPTVDSLNDGDCFLLIAQNRLYVYNGTFSNVIEQARASDVAGSILKTNDLGCRVCGSNNNANERVVQVGGKGEKGSEREERGFWRALGVEEVGKGREMVANAGNPSEDEIYETNLTLTNMIYRLENEELVPIDEYWGCSPKYEMLTSTSVYVFDFGTEMYVWSGKNADVSEKRTVLKLAKELWNEGYDYKDCTVCPITVSSVLGDRKQQKIKERDNNTSSKRPEWTLFAKLTQHRETVLFREKFSDWPDFTRLIKVKGAEQPSDVKGIHASDDIKPIDLDVESERPPSLPDLIVEGNHLGRGDSYFDEETKRRFEFDTVDLKMWKITENSYELLEGESTHGQFYEGDSYIIRWRYRVTVKGRELSGKPSKYAQVGRDSTAYFYWQGGMSSTNEKGVAALLTVELDSESAPQIRVTQGNEPAAFLRLFGGGMMVHKGKMTDKERKGRQRLYITRGELEKETYLLEVKCEADQLRSRTSLAMFDSLENTATLWHGCKSSRQTRAAIRTSIDRLFEDAERLKRVGLRDGATIVEVEEGREEGSAFDDATSPAFENIRQRYVSFLNEGSERRFDHTPRFFSFSSVSGRFAATEIVSAHRSEHACPMPVLQDQLYAASQPALFLIDNEHELWLWQGWWPPIENEEGVAIASSDQAGSAAVRWQAERRAAMRTALDYWTKKKSKKMGDKARARLVWAGFEPMEFRNLFPFWTEREDAKESNEKEKRHLQERSMEEELALLSRTEFPLSELLERPLPEGVDPTHLEDYLSKEDFESLMSMSKEEFQKLPSWKQTALKKERGLF